MCTLLRIVVFLWFVFPVMGQTNRALIIAISNYPIENGWGETHAVNDCDLLIPMLKANGYKPSDITVLINEEATKKNIIKELKRLAERSETKDYVYIHFSGHGQQMADYSGDEPDFLDESFIPYDAYYRYIPGKYEGENHLRDDELETLIDRIRYRIGKNGNVMVVLDACYSGTGTRVIEDDDYVRGTSYIFAPAGFKPKLTTAKNFRLDFKKNETLSPITVFSACQPEELNFEYKTGTPAVYYGSLTYFFCESMKERVATETNQSFFLRVKKKMHSYFSTRNKTQTPYFESTVKDNLFNISK